MAISSIALPEVLSTIIRETVGKQKLEEKNRGASLCVVGMDGSCFCAYGMLHWVGSESGLYMCTGDGKT